MIEITDTALLIMGAISLIPAVFALQVDPLWHLIAFLFFPIFVIAYMTVKIKQRINAALKRIAVLEEEEKRVARKELNAFVGDYHDNDSV